MDYKCMLDESYKKLSSTFPAGIWLFEVNTTTSQIIITGFFWRYCDDFQQVNGRRWVVVWVKALWSESEGSRFEPH